MNDLQQNFGLTENMYSENKENIVKNDDIIIDIENIRFQIIYRDFSNPAVRQQKDNFSPAHTHPYYEIHIFYDENKVIDIEDVPISVPYRQALIVFPNTYHHFPNENMPLLHSNMSLHITKKDHHSGLDYYTPFMEALHRHKDFYIIPPTIPFIDYIEKTRLYYQDITRIKWTMIKSILTLMFSELILLFCPNDESLTLNKHAINETDFRNQTIHTFFVRNYNRDITLGELSAILKLSEKQTGRLVKKMFGTDFQSYLTEIRLKNAKRLLKETNDEIQSIAERVGYKSYNGFYLAFKKFFGITPFAYRKKHR